MCFQKEPPAPDEVPARDGILGDNALRLQQTALEDLTTITQKIEGVVKKGILGPKIQNLPEWQGELERYKALQRWQASASNALEICRRMLGSAEARQGLEDVPGGGDSGCRRGACEVSA